LADNTNSHPHTSSLLLGEMDLAAYLGIARRRKYWIILATVGVIIATAVFAKRLPDIFTAETVILVDSAQVPDKYIPSLNTGDIAGRLSTLQQQVLSPSRVKKLVEAQGLYPESTGKRTEADIVQSVQNSIIVEIVNAGAGKMSAFRIAYSSRNRLQVAKVANQLAQMFIEENSRARVDQTQDTAEFLRDQLQETKRQLDEKDSELRAIKSHNIMEMPESKPYHMEALANLRAQAQGIQDKIQQAQRDRSMLQSMMLSNQQAPTVDLDNATGTGATSLYQTEIQKLETRLMQLRTRYGPSHPEVRKAKDDLDRLKARAANESREDAAVVEPPPPAPQADGQKRRNPVLEAQIQKLNEEMQQQTAQLEPLQVQMKFHESKLEQMPIFEQQIARLQADCDILKTQYTGLLDKEKAAELSHALEVRQKGEKFEVLDAASTPNKPAAPNRLLICVAGVLGGLLAGIALAAIAEMNDESVRTEGDAIRILGKPVLSAIPQIVSIREQRLNFWRMAGLLAGTVVGSAALGLILSIVSGRIL
jgi:polysaccharide chain length determinant protein (PEP-CTERM system associated)